MKCVQKVCTFDTISKRNKCSFCSFLKIILFAFVNQDLSHVLCDEEKSHLCHFYVFIVKIAMLLIVNYEDKNEKSAEASFRMIL